MFGFLILMQKELNKNAISWKYVIHFAKYNKNINTIINSIDIKYYLKKEKKRWTNLIVQVLKIIIFMTELKSYNDFYTSVHVWLYF